TLRRCFRLDMLLDEEAQAVEAVRDVLATLAGLDALGETIPREVFVETFERECRRRRLGPAVPRGVAVLDAMAARGLPFRHVFLLGLNARVFPRFIVEEPFISDAARREVFRVLGHHLPVRFDALAYDRARAFLAALDGERAVSAFEGRVGPLTRHWTARSIGHLSATRLERFATCPFRYFAEEVLRILPADDVLEGEDLDPREIGRLMH